ncbi:MAG TPA: glycosyltransferase [Solirubrobacteraceae bacterium]|nr:glycosyltransferase [Solirubrobacteraceae bacterium]
MSKRSGQPSSCQPNSGQPNSRVSSGEPPLVSAIILTHQFEAYLAQSIDSVLAQDYPADRLEVVVIDDGSTDSTKEVIAPYLDRVRYVYKDNGGLLSSVNRGFAEARGELLALQSGDDMWTPDKLARQVAILRERPEVGLVYGDMMVVDNDHNVLEPSFWASTGIVPRRGRPLGALVRGNFVSGGTMIVRAELRERFHPLPDHAGWEDWWIAARVAEVAELEYVSEPLLRYRFHGANMSLGADASKAQANAAHEMPFRRWLLTDLQIDSIAPADLVVGCRLYEHCVVAAATQGGLTTQEVVPRNAQDGVNAFEHVRLGHEALLQGDVPRAMRAAARAFGYDVHDANVRALFQTACAALERQPVGAVVSGAPTRASAAVADTGAPTGASAGVADTGAPMSTPAAKDPPARSKSARAPKRASSSSSDSPRVTLGIATFNRDTYLAESISSALAQDYDDFEVLVVDDGSTNPVIARVLDSFDDPRLRVVRHRENRGIAAGYDTMVREGRGELIAMHGDDDISLPDRLSREVAVFDAHPDTGVVHGDALVIDADGKVTGRWDSRDFSPAALVQAFFRSHNHLIDPTRMVHRRVYDDVGGYDSSYKLAQDMHFWLRAARAHRFRHCAGGPLIGFRRHGANMSDESARQLEIDDVERALEEAMERYSLRELVPELDWAVLDRADAERQALERIADGLDGRLLPLSDMAARVRARARSTIEKNSLHPAPRQDGESTPAQSWRESDDNRRTSDKTKHPPDLSGNPHKSGTNSRGRLLMTAFGWNDSGGGTIVPRLTAKELARRGWDVTVFHAATRATESRTPYEVVESEEDGVRLIAVHNRAHALWDLRNPLRELDDPPITAAFAAALDRFKPDVVHFHNLHNLGAALIDQTAARGLPSYFSTHNYWLICPRAYLMTGTGEMCGGPGDGSKCASCVQSAEHEAHRLRLQGIRSRVGRGVSACLTVSDSVRRTLIAAGYPAEMLDVVRQGMPHDGEIWERLGRDRKPGRVGARLDRDRSSGDVDARLTVAFLGSAYPHKGPQLLVQAAQRTSAELRIQIHGEIPDAFAAQLRELDQRGVVELCGAFQPSEIERVLAEVDVAALPSIWWDCAPLAAAECLAARVPLLAPRLGGLSEAITDGVDGLLFDALSVEDLTRCLDRVAGEPGLLERLQAGIAAPRAFSAYVDDLESYYAGERPGRVLEQAPVEQLAVRWQGDHGLATSLSIINGRVSERLGARIQRVARDGRALDPPLPHAADVEVRHQWPPDLSPAAAGRLAVIQPWEFGAIPRDWIPQLREHVDELWVPSEYVREMYLGAGLEPERVVTIANGVDLQRFSPEGERYPLPVQATTTFLFVGGLIWRKGPDVLLRAWQAAFAGREDVLLVVKDVGAGAGGVYRDGEREAIAAHAASGALPRILLIGDELEEQEIAALYRACDVLVHPYRGEGFGMPVLEAMASGLPAIVTGGGPTDEFCPPDAGWRIRSSRAEFPDDRVDHLDTAGRPWVLEPDVEHLAELLHDAAADPQARSQRGAAGRTAAEAYAWDEIADRYAQRLARLAAQAPLAPSQPREFEEDAAVRVLATPAWRGEDRLPELLRQWCATTTPASSACLYLLADPRADGSQDQLEARVLAAGVDLDDAADVTILIEAIDANGDLALHRAMDAFIPLHSACGGHARMAADMGSTVLSLDRGELTGFLAAQVPVAAL